MRLQGKSDDANEQSAPTITIPSWINDSSDNLGVAFTPKAMAGLNSLGGDLGGFSSVSDLKSAIVSILQGDPRSVYRKTKCDDRLYFFSVGCCKCTVWFDEGVAEVLKVERERMNEAVQQVP